MTHCITDTLQHNPTSVPVFMLGPVQHYTILENVTSREDKKSWSMALQAV
ncbi:hypothetical protein JYT44_00180 [Caldithrix abyssi]|nr:hypothetical protein [Caldithrix abyssi]